MLVALSRVCYAVAMRIALLVATLIGFGCGGSAESSLRKQYRQLTEQQRPSFESPGDSVTIAPTPDTGIFGQGDATHDCSSCPPR